MQGSIRRQMAVAAFAGVGMIVPAGWAALPLASADAPAVPGRAAIMVPAPAEGSSAVKSAEGGEDVLDFINNDRLRGQLLAIGAAPAALRWKSAESDNPIDFGMSHVARITLAKRAKEKEVQAGPGTRVYLSNDDVLFGTVVSMDGDKLALDTWYAGRMSIQRAMIQSVVPSGEPGQRIYEGPSEIESWTVFRRNNVPSWRYKNGALYALNTYPIARNIEGLPEQVEIEFEASWRFDYPSFLVSLFTDNLQQQQGNCYALMVSGNTIYMQRFTRNAGSESLWQMNYDQFGNGRKNRARFTILADKGKKAFVLLIDGQLVRQWTDNNSFAGQGPGLLFQSQSQGGLKIAKIRIAGWDGKIPQPGGGVKPESKSDVLRFVNNDLVSGSVVSIAEGKVKFETSYAPLEIPLERIAEIQMAADKLERARRNKSDARLSFAQGGLVTLNLQSVANGEVKGASENFGELRLPLSAVQVMDLNIYREKAEDEDVTEEMF